MIEERRIAGETAYRQWLQDMMQACIKCADAMEDACFIKQADALRNISMQFAGELGYVCKT